MQANQYQKATIVIGMALALTRCTVPKKSSSNASSSIVHNISFYCHCATNAEDEIICATNAHNLCSKSNSSNVHNISFYAFIAPVQQIQKMKQSFIPNVQQTQKMKYCAANPENEIICAGNPEDEIIFYSYCAANPVENIIFYCPCAANPVPLLYTTKSLISLLI